MAIPNPPSLVEYGHMRFLIFDAPNEENLPAYAKEFKHYNVKHIVRACEPTYEDQEMEANGFVVHDFSFPDGGSPPEEILERWLDLVKTVVTNSKHDAIGIHCVAGLGRAPVLVAIALIENGMQPLQAVTFIRSKRRGAINVNQLQYLKNYKPHFNKGKCIVM
eukprot:TRINITY_DN3769_c0_g1_i1.p1 TRINITY_DN3769_c0_g1~~TRINITY_DN3769_c0_g1_i1.p1  ORF type:complete len:163 (-),score=52.54 TRINITY_DN3769_c0_g1_i1:165-653(-)